MHKSMQLFTGIISAETAKFNIFSPCTDSEFALADIFIYPITAAAAAVHGPAGTTI
jgi:hypothetical protein